MSFDWLRLKKSYLTDAKFNKLPDIAKWHYIGCYLIAGEAMSEGVIAQANTPLSPEDMAITLRCDFKEFRKSFDLLISLNFIALGDDFYYIVRFLDEQTPDGKNPSGEGITDYWKKQQRKYREKIRSEENRTEQKRTEEIKTEKNRTDKKRIEQNRDVKDMSRTFNNDKENNNYPAQIEEEESSMPF